MTLASRLAGSWRCGLGTPSVSAAAAAAAVLRTLPSSVGPRATRGCASLRPQKDGGGDDWSEDPRGALTIASSGEGEADDPSREWVLNPDLRPHIRAGLSRLMGRAEPAHEWESSEEADPGLRSVLQRDTGLSVCLLGTGAGSPSLNFSNTATAVRMGSKTYLFDAGEGVQVQLMKSRIKRGDIASIFVTHMHGDHVFGLPGLLLALQTAAKAVPEPARKRGSTATTRRGSSEGRRLRTLPTLRIYGPEGLHAYLASSLSLTHADLKQLRVEVYELVGAQGSGRAAVPSPPPLSNLIRRSVPPDNDSSGCGPHTWTLQEPDEFTSPSQVATTRHHGRWRGVYVKAAELHHNPRLPCFGYVVREPRTQPRTIDVKKATALGVRPGRKYNLLKFGFSVESDDDPSVTVHPDQVCIGGPVVARSVAVLGDCCNVPDAMAELCRGADVLVHEATLCERDSGPKLLAGGHSTAAMAGRVARGVGAKVLLLNHISTTLRHPASELALMREAERELVRKGGAAPASAARVQIGYDHLELLVPRTGFPW